MPLDRVGRSMSFGEAIRLTSVLATDPSSHVAAALGGWSHPLSRADMTLRDLYDVQLASKSKRKPKPYPRPWDTQPTRTGGGTSMTVAEFRAIKANLSSLQAQPRDAAGRFVKAR